MHKSTVISFSVFVLGMAFFAFTMANERKLRDQEEHFKRSTVSSGIHLPCRWPGASGGAVGIYENWITINLS